MFTLLLPTKNLNMREELQRIAEEWNADVQQVPEGYILLPEYMMRIHGVHITEEPGGWRFGREADATTWEDFLLMHITHRLAADHGMLLEYEWKGIMRFIEPTPDVFHSFDAYAEKVLAKEEGLVRDMKKNWIYAHRTRYVR